MKYWCYYTDVVRYLERIEAGQFQKTAAPAYLVWQDDDGPSMIVGPGVEWHRGDGPPPDIDAINVSAGRPPAPAPPDRNTQSRKTWRAHSCVPCCHSWRHVLGPQARHQTDPTDAPAFHPPKKANKRSANFPKPAQIRSSRAKKQQSLRRQPAGKTPNDPASIKSRTATSRAATSRDREKMRPSSQSSALRLPQKRQLFSRLCRPRSPANRRRSPQRRTDPETARLLDSGAGPEVLRQRPSNGECI